ncbi:conserved hypothetical protein [Methanocella paludicola SANAE]|uniref:DUF2207 domain-containing protein n=1 Tax=Methanocella paludicola (strain DSM 17711 / JCM 13418 / NBRC 101707 / SANAE) TaxID=304371 RepID=D1Z276_METPS|nr:DUF2207 domain-containing protein [Methanocella paludicola]BAI62798.1 conserved hypothetical protein [Methanocella paludicola SANAE]
MHRRIISLLLIVLISLSLMPYAHAQETYRWQVSDQHVVLDIDPSGSVYMTYEVNATIVKGVWNEVWIPVTVSSMQVEEVVDGSGNRHAFTVSGGQIKTQGWNLNPGDNVYLRINSNLPGFVYKADTAGYDIVEFIPPWWDMDITDTQVKFYLPGNVPKDQVYTGSKLYDNIGVEDNRTWVYFESKDLSPNQQFKVAVSFPDSYMASGAVIDKQGGYTPGTGIGLGLVESLFSCSCPMIFVAFIFIMIIGSIGGSLLRKPYDSPVVSMDGIGVNKNLDPVEAATLLRIDPKRVLTMIMFGLMKKGNIKLLGTDPIRLEPVSRKGLNYYEKLYMDAIVDDKLDEDKLLECFKVLARRVVDKTRPYCRKDTEDYYRSKIEEAWAEIKAVDTPELKLEKYDTNMFWLMADEQFTKKTKEYVSDAPGSNTVFVPNYYWWYPYYFGLPHHWGTHGTPTTGAPQTGAPQTGTPQAGAPQAPTNRTTTTVESFANSISNSVEATAAGVVGGVEKFLGVRNEANAPPAATSYAPASARGHSGGGGSCACVSCACACVSCACACACAGGGGGCT